MPRVDLAGFNVDADWLAELVADLPVRPDLTPETVSAAYARISRDPRPVGELRRAARAEVPKARASNERIVFGLGHASVAEHAVFNLDVLDVSRLAIEALESHRLASYTEKSQRYVRLGEDCVVPAEVRERGLANDFQDFMSRAFARYALLVARLMAAGVDDKLAGEDARYALPLAVTGQLGMTLNARSLEHLVLSLASHPLAEVRDLADRLLAVAKPVAPSLLRYMTPGPYHRQRPADLAAAARDLLGPALAAASAGSFPASPAAAPSPLAPPSFADPGDALPAPDAPTAVPCAGGTVRLLEAPADGDALVLSALAATALGLPAAAARSAVAALPAAARRRLFDAAVAHLGPHDALPREFEHASFTAEVVLSAAAYGQLKRHRMSTLSPSAYDPALGLTVPPAIADHGLADVLAEGAAEAEAFAARLGGPADPVSAYALLNAHRRRCLWTLNLREFYHVSRLREDAHAQWDIRSLTAALSTLVRAAFPACAALLGGKDAFPRHPDPDPQP